MDTLSCLLSQRLTLRSSAYSPRLSYSTGADLFPNRPSMIVAMPPPMSSNSRSRPQTPVETSPTTTTLAPLLPPIAALPSISISPLNSNHRAIHSPDRRGRSESHTFAHSYSPTHSVPPLLGARLRSCRQLGCANYAKINGYCAAHYHNDDAGTAATSTPSCTPTARLPSLRIDHSNERPRLPPPAAPIFYGTRSHDHSDNHNHSPLYMPDHYAPYPTLPSLSARRFSEPLPRLASLPRVSPLHRMRPTDDAFAQFRRAQPTHHKASPTHSIGSVDTDTSPSATTTSQTPKAKCRRENCENAARRKGLCMEHGGRHFCKMEGCQKCAHRGGYCIAHGGGRRCAIANCTKSAQSGGVCYSHGGGKRCATEGCSHAARSGGFCIKHGKMAKARTTDDAKTDDSE